MRPYKDSYQKEKAWNRAIKKAEREAQEKKELARLSKTKTKKSKKESDGE